ncbi:MAG: mechanosensitive ion channel family protein [Endomicrobia bacterium]|nr:mechanosensitive ion channel family protein [Endomicrobiia bacterium]
MNLHFLSAVSPNLTLWTESIAVFSLIIIVGFLFRNVILKLLQKALWKIGLNVSNEAVGMAKNYVAFWMFLAALYFGYKTSPIEYNAPAAKIYYGIFAFSAVLLLASIASKIFKRAVSETIGENMIKFIVIFVGTILILNQLGIKFTPILTALGIGSLAVALALQDTLGNLFAGMNLVANKQIMRGDYIKLDSGQEGTVIDINWRTTRIMELSNNIITIPNLKLSSAVITNYHTQQPELTVSVNCGVSYDSDLDKVEKTAIAAAKEVIDIMPGGVKTYTPAVRFNQFAESSINFAVIFKVRDMYSKGEILHEVVKKLHKRFEEENIVIPFPRRVVSILNENAEKSK